MCNYIKENGDECSIDNHEGDFCHHHRDTQFAALWEKIQSREEVESDASGDASRVEGVDTCGACDSAVRTSTRLREHPNKPRSVVVQFYLHCDCSGYVLTEETVSKTEMPWIEDGRGSI